MYAKFGMQPKGAYIMLIHTERETYLQSAVEELRPSFSANGHTLPLAIRVSCALPSNAKRSGAIGECWADTRSSDGHYEIFISPTLDNPARVFDVLIHELCHTAKGCMNHGVNFQKLAEAMLLIPASNTWKATVGAPTFMDAYGSIIEGLGDYPHAALDMSSRKTQGTRMLKASCPSCSYTVRLTAKWAFDPWGSPRLPVCPCGDTLALV
jgi:hypothetical protein